MPRCGCATDCLCVLVSGDCTALVGSGTISAPYAVNVVIDPAVENLVECRPTGLYVPPSTVTVADTDCIDLSGDGSVGDPISADPILAADVCNLLECVPDGLVVLLRTDDTTCIDLSGCGTLGDPLTADAVVSALPDNIISCEADGLYAPAAAAGAPCRATITRSGVQVLPPSAGAGIASVAQVAYDLVVEDPCAYVAPTGGGGELGFVVPAGLGGWHILQMEDRDNAFAINLATTVNIQIRVNGAPVGTLIFDRMLPTQKALYTARGITLFVGDIVEGFWVINDPAGPTAPHALGATQPIFLTITRIGP